MSISIYIATPSKFVVTDVNMSNVNAMDLWRYLGLSPDATGEISAIDLLRTCQSVGVNDDGDPGIQERHSARVHMMGRRPGYYATRIGELIEVAVQALRLSVDSTITWG